MAHTPFPSVPAVSPLLSASEIASRFFGGTRTPRWVLQHVCPEKRLEFTPATIRWREYDVLEWIQMRHRSLNGLRPRRPTRRR